MYSPTNYGDDNEMKCSVYVMTSHTNSSDNNNNEVLSVRIIRTATFPRTIYIYAWLNVHVIGSNLMLR